MPTVYSNPHQHLTLGTRIGSGGEGDVFLVEGDAKVVAKIYHTPPNKHKAAKLQFMAENHDADLNKIAAWVTQVLYGDVECSQIIGFLMPKVENAKPIHELYNTKSRKQHFPQADWNFLVHTALNVANAFAVVHAHGHTIGDVNHSSIFVKRDGTVVLIDCDSFEINTETETFPSLVGVPEFTPPELQNIPFDEIDRTPNHDHFGLAVMIFHLLFLGRHPFSGVFLGKGEMNTIQAIAEKRFAYGDDAKVRKMQPPPFTMLFEVLPDEMEVLFRRAFLEEDRPNAEAWKAALERLLPLLKVCADNASHQFPPDANDCPWCRIEAKTSITTYKYLPSIDFKRWEILLEMPIPMSELMLPVKPSDTITKFKVDIQTELKKRLEARALSTLELKQEKQITYFCLLVLGVIFSFGLFGIGGFLIVVPLIFIVYLLLKHEEDKRMEQIISIEIFDDSSYKYPIGFRSNYRVSAKISEIRSKYHMLHNRIQNLESNAKLLSLNTTELSEQQISLKNQLEKFKDNVQTQLSEKLAPFNQFKHDILNYEKSYRELQQEVLKQAKIIEENKAIQRKYHQAKTDYDYLIQILEEAKLKFEESHSFSHRTWNFLAFLRPRV